jgi:hypothetical protein
MPIPLPVAFVTEDKRLVIGYFGTPRISAVETKFHVTQILNNLVRVPVLLVKCCGVDSRAFLAALHAFADERKLVPLHAIEKRNWKYDTFDNSVRILKSHWNAIREREVREGLQQLHDNAQVAFCKKCGMLFSKCDGPTCRPPKQTGGGVDHELDQIRGKMPQLAISDATTLAE